MEKPMFASSPRCLPASPRSSAGSVSVGTGRHIISQKGLQKLVRLKVVRLQEELCFCETHEQSHCTERIAYITC